MSKGIWVDYWSEEEPVLLCVDPKLLNEGREERATEKKLLQDKANRKKHDSPVISDTSFFEKLYP